MTQVSFNVTFDVADGTSEDTLKELVNTEAHKVADEYTAEKGPDVFAVDVTKVEQEHTPTLGETWQEFKHDILHHAS
jgi:hypothetical protein